MVDYVNRFLVFGLRIFFRLLYHPFAQAYDWVAATVSLGKWIGWVRTALPYLNEQPILELGFGPGHLQKAACAQGINIFGLDESQQMARLAIKKLSKDGYSPRLVRGVAQALPFPADTFGQMVATFPSEYIVQKDTLSEVYRVLLPGGKLVILPVAKITGPGVLDRLTAWLFRITHQAPANDRMDWKSTFIRPLERAGFTVQVEEISQPTSSLVFFLATKPSQPGQGLLPEFAQVL